VNSILIAIAVIAAVLLVWQGLRRRSARKEKESQSDNVDTVTGWMPQATRVLTKAEGQAFDTLRSALPAHIVLAQVPVARFIKVPTRNSYAEWLRRVGHLCADFVVCDRNSLVVAVVEVHSATAVNSDRVLRRQQRLARVMKAAAIPVHVWLDDALPTAAQAREAIVPSPPASEPAAAGSQVQAPSAKPLPSVLQPSADEPGDPEDFETAEIGHAPPSTWFDDLETAPAPLTQNGAPATAKPSPERKDRPLR
jgi:hypothetical protein